MKTYSVIALWEEDGATGIYPVEAADQVRAMSQVARTFGADGMLIIGAIEGEHTLLHPSDANNLSAYAIDMEDLEDLS